MAVPRPRPFSARLPGLHLPGHVRTLFSALGGGADDERLEGTAVEEAVNYHIDFVKAPPGNGAALHSHGSEETFIALTAGGRSTGETKAGNPSSSRPSTGWSYRTASCGGFRNVGRARALLLTVLGAHNAGHCVWAQSLRSAFAAAAR